LYIRVTFGSKDLQAYDLFIIQSKRANTNEDLKMVFSLLKRSSPKVYTLVIDTIKKNKDFYNHLVSNKII
jgi:hypothetical protein